MSPILKLVYMAVGIMIFGFTFAFIVAIGALMMYYVNPVLGFVVEAVGLGWFNLRVMRMKSN